MSNFELLLHIEDNMVEIEEGFGSALSSGIGSVGGVLGGFTARLSTEKRNLNRLTKEHEGIRKRLNRRPDNEPLRKREAFVHAEIITARQKYSELRTKYKEKSKQVSKSASTKVGHSVSNTASKAHNYITGNFHR